MRKNQKERIENLEAEIQPVATRKTTRYKILQTFADHPVLSANQVGQLSGISYQTAMRELQHLLVETHHRAAAFTQAKIQLEGKEGRPTKVFSLTDVGAAVLRKLTGDSTIRASRLGNGVEITHTYLEVSTVLQAEKAGHIVSREHEITFDQSRHIRVDVLVTVDGITPALFEIEQAAESSSLPRIVDKLDRLADFFASDEGATYDNDIRILFNGADSLEKTLAIWHQALTLVTADRNGNVPFILHWLSFLKFESNPGWDSLDMFSQIEASAPEGSPTEGSKRGKKQTIVSEIPGASNDLMQEMNVVMRATMQVYQQQFKLLENADSHQERCAKFFDLILLIYEASHYADSPVVLYAGKPVMSLELLKRYLNAHQNKKLHDDLCRALKWARSKNTGVTNLRNAMTQVFWDGFLRHHGFYRGGPLRVNFEAPDLGGVRSDYYVNVYIRDSMYPDKPHLHSQLIGGKSQLETALAWVLESIYLHASELDLNDRPWS